MTKKRALELLLHYTARFNVGPGCGPGYLGITEKDRKLTYEAIVKIWPYAYGHKITESELYNLHIQPY